VIDTHCHLLARIDDGPRSGIESVGLARMLAAQGVVAAVCTPHFSPRFPTPVEKARAGLEALRRDLDELGVPLRIELAAEVAFSLVEKVPLEELRLRSIAGFVLVELDGRVAARAPAVAQERLAEGGLRPIFAHPERSPAVRRDPVALEEARAAGALVQVVLSSLAGRRGVDAARAGWALLEASRADLLASDSHSARGSASRLRETLAEAERRYGPEAVTRLTATTPARIIDAAQASSCST
jgi:protein-tyrosine phosphatase